MKSSYHVLAQNIHALQPKKEFSTLKSRRFLLCWKCQTEKTQRNGKHSIMGASHVFICKDCIDAKKEQCK